MTTYRYCADVLLLVPTYLPTTALARLVH